MLREVLTSRAILAGIIFFLLVVGSSLLYDWHVRCEMAGELVQTALSMQQPENKKEKRTAQDAGVSIGIDRVGETRMSLEVDEAQARSEETETVIDEVSESVDIAEAFFFDETMQAAPAEEIRISPFGFGPYPELPPGYPNPDLWDYADALYALSPERAHDWELRERVCIKLWKQGKKSESVAMENGLVYPCYENTVYVRWDKYIDDDGTRVAYITELLGPPSTARYNDDFDNNIIPPGVTVIPYEEGGIDPYTFLNLN